MLLLGMAVSMVWSVWRAPCSRRPRVVPTSRWCGHDRDRFGGRDCRREHPALAPSRSGDAGRGAKGAIAYRFFIAVALNSDFIGLWAQDLNLVTALLVAFALVLLRLKSQWLKRKS